MEQSRFLLKITKVMTILFLEEERAARLGLPVVTQNNSHQLN